MNVLEERTQGEDRVKQGGGFHDLQRSFGSIDNHLVFREYALKYPQDNEGEELAPNARVWKIYRDEAIEFDKDLLDEWHKTIDWMLIFVRSFTGSDGTIYGTFDPYREASMPTYDYSC